MLSTEQACMCIIIITFLYVQKCYTQTSGGFNRSADQKLNKRNASRHFMSLLTLGFHSGMGTEIGPTRARERSQSDVTVEAKRVRHKLSFCPSLSSPAVTVSPAAQKSPWSDSSSRREQLTTACWRSLQKLCWCWVFQSESVLFTRQSRIYEYVCENSF